MTLDLVDSLLNYVLVAFEQHGGDGVLRYRVGTRFGRTLARAMGSITRHLLCHYISLIFSNTEFVEGHH